MGELATPSLEDLKQNASQGRVRVPLLFQLEASESGVACLGMMMRFHGVWATLEQVRALVGVGRDGIPIERLAEVARHKGLKARSVPMPLETLIREPFGGRNARPVMLLWEQSKYVLLTGIEGDKVHLVDADEGLMPVDWDELLEKYSGQALVIEGVEAGVKTGRERTLIQEILPLIPSLRATSFFLMLTGGGLVIPGLALPAFAKVFVDEFLINQLDGWIAPLLFGMLGAIVMQGLLIFLQERVIQRMKDQMTDLLSLRLMIRMFQMPISYFAQRPAADLVDRLGTGARITELVAEYGAGTVANIVSLVAFTVILMLFDPVIASIGIGLLLINSIFMKLVYAKRDAANRLYEQDQGRLFAETVVALEGMENLRSSARANDFFARWTGIHAELMAGAQRLSLIDQWMGLVPNVMDRIAAILVLGLGGIKVMNGSWSLGELFAFQILFGTLSGPLASVMSVYSNLHSMRTEMENVNDILNFKGSDSHKNAYFGTVRHNQETNTFIPGRGDLSISGLSYAHSPFAPPVISGISMDIPAGSHVAIVGASGSGKTTLIRAISGLYPIEAGMVTIDGVAIPDLDPMVKARTLSLVEAKPTLFPGTVRDNICLWDDTISPNAMIRAAQDACIHDVISTRFNGYAGFIREEGQALSGGQKQQLEIARGLVHNPKILIMDEAMAAIDSLNEKQIEDNLKKRGMTIITVAHRLSRVRHADCIYVMDHGQIVEFGSHENLLEKQGHYATLLREGVL